MRVLDIEQLPSFVVPGRKGLVHHIIADRESGFEKFEILYAKMERGGIGYLHSHPHSEHFQFVLEGSLEVGDSRGERVKVPAGSGLLVEAGEEHEVVNTYDGITRYIVVYAPPL